MHSNQICTVISIELESAHKHSPTHRHARTPTINFFAKATIWTFHWHWFVTINSFILEHKIGYHWTSNDLDAIETGTSLKVIKHFDVQVVCVCLCDSTTACAFQLHPISCLKHIDWSIDPWLYQIDTLWSFVYALVHYEWSFK